MTNAIINLVADIGGTNIRIALAKSDASFCDVMTFQCSEYNSLADVLSAYIAEKNLSSAKINACLAIACPVDTDLISMTNLPWSFSKSALKISLNFNQLWLINDYTAIAHAIPLLNNEQKVQIGEGTAIENQPISICGPGTGLGVANLISADDKWHCISGEGGHVDFAPVDELEIKILSYMLKKKQHRISYEQFLSGKGLEQLYQALLAINNMAENELSADQISAKALDKSCTYCQQALAQFCKILGSFAGNLALTMSSFGGVYIAGGIVPRFIDYLKMSDFRDRFTTKGRLSSFIENIPTFVITEAQPGLLGASAYLLQKSLQEHTTNSLETEEL